MEAEWLESHNIHRKCCGVPQLQWDNTLAQRAQEWADYLKSEDDGLPRHPDASAAERDQYLSYDGRNYTTSPIGQNIAWNWGRNIDNGGSPSNSVDAWYLEGEFYDQTDPSLYCDGCDPESGDELGHFTQLCWEGSTKVGCGVSETINNNVPNDNGVLGDENSTVWVCNYSPAGNVLAAGSDPYTRFKTNVGTWEPDCESPVTQAPVTQAPVTQAPVTQAPDLGDFLHRFNESGPPLPITEDPDKDDVSLPPPPVIPPDIEKKTQQHTQQMKREQESTNKQKSSSSIGLYIILFLFILVVLGIVIL